jgi:hypothetical protein
MPARKFFGFRSFDLCLLRWIFSIWIWHVLVMYAVYTRILFAIGVFVVVHWMPRESVPGPIWGNFVLCLPSA